MNSPALVHNGDNNGTENNDRQKYEFLKCYPENHETTPPELGNHPIPQFPFEWEPDEKKKDAENYSKNNPFTMENWTNRIHSGEKISSALEEWAQRLENNENTEKAKRISRLSFRVKNCFDFSVGMQDGRNLATSATGAAYFRSVERCNSRFCPRCARKAGRKSLERIFKRCSIDPETDATPLRFLTLTMPGENGASLKSRYDRIRKALKKLYRSKLWENRVNGSIGKIEVTKNGENWHVHAHFLLKGNFMPNDELRIQWAKALGEEPEKINYPWIEKPKKGKGAFFEMAKYIAKPVAFIGKNKSKNNSTSDSKEWTSDQMVEFFEVFQGARIFMTTGDFKKPPEITEEIEEKEQSKSDKLKEIITKCPINYEAAKNGHKESLADIIFDAGMEGFSKVEVLKEFSFIFHAYEPDDLRAPDAITKWSPDPKNIEKGRILKAIEWERRRIFKEELKRSREELAASCELNGAHW